MVGDKDNKHPPEAVVVDVVVEGNNSCNTPVAAVE